MCVCGLHVDNSFLYFREEFGNLDDPSAISGWAAYRLTADDGNGGDDVDEGTVPAQVFCRGCHWMGVCGESNSDLNRQSCSQISDLRKIDPAGRDGGCHKMS